MYLSRFLRIIREVRNNLEDISLDSKSILVCDSVAGIANVSVCFSLIGKRICIGISEVLEDKNSIVQKNLAIVICVAGCCWCGNGSGCINSYKFSVIFFSISLSS